MNARSLVSPVFSAVSWPRIDFRSSRAQFNIAQGMMVLGYLALIFNPFDGDAMLLGLTCQALALTFYVFSRSAETPVGT